MTDATALEALAVRVESGEKGREIDADIALHFGWSVFPGDNWIGPYGEIAVPRVSTSLDACAALAERVLPGRQWRMSVYSDGSTEVECWEPIQKDDTGRQLYFPVPNGKSDAPTECAARLAAILRAKAKGSE